MVLSKREKYILYCTLAVLGIFVLDRYAISPLLAMRQETRDRAAQLSTNWDRASNLLERQENLEKRWLKYTEQGIYEKPSETTARVLHEVRNWSSQYGVNLSSITPDRISTKEDQEIQEITFLMSGTGNMKAIGNFLFQLEHTDLPLRLKDIQLSSRQVAVDDMSIQVRVSTIYFPKESKKVPEQDGRFQPIGGIQR